MIAFLSVQAQMEAWDNEQQIKQMERESHAREVAQNAKQGNKGRRKQ